MSFAQDPAAAFDQQQAIATLAGLLQTEATRDRIHRFLAGGAPWPEDVTA
jgi:hypothetical protein